MMSGSLAGKRIVITRPPHRAQAFAAQLHDLGAEPVLMPTIDIQPPSDPAPLDQALMQLEDFDWVVITSTNVVTHLWRRFEALGIVPDALDWPAVAAIGPVSSQALQANGITPALLPEHYVAEALFAALDDRVDLNGLHILVPQGNLARPVLVDRLREEGARVVAVVAYENASPTIDPSLLDVPVDAVTFTSASTVENFVAAVDDPLALIGGALVACIGPVTADAARALGLPVHVVADPHTVEGLIAGLNCAFERNAAP